MPQFAYKARDNKGMLVQGILDADTPASVRKKLGEQGLIPVLVKVASNGLGATLTKMFQPKVGDEDLVLFTKQFYTLFRAGMGIETLLDTLGRQTTNPLLKETLEKVRQDVQQGSGLAKAFAKHPNVFDALYVNMLASGEEAGILDEVLNQLANVMEKDFAVRRGIKSATLYPKIVITFLVLAISGMMIFVVPRFKDIFTSLGADLPLPTIILMATSDFMCNYFPLIAIGVGVLFFLFHRYKNTPKGRFKVDALSFKVPVFGPLSLKVANARFANILASLYRSGMPMTKALEITGPVLNNEAFLKDVKTLQSDVERGASLSESMRNLKYFSPVVVEATSIGEKTGSLDEMLKSIAEHYDMEIDHTVKNLTTMLEPILLIFVFGLVAIFALAIFLPMFKMSQAVLNSSK